LGAAPLPHVVGVPWSAIAGPAWGGSPGVIVKPYPTMPMQVPCLRFRAQSTATAALIVLAGTIPVGGAILIDDFSENAAGNGNLTFAYSDLATTPSDTVVQSGLSPVLALGGQRALHAAYAGTAPFTYASVLQRKDTGIAYFQLQNVNIVDAPGEVALADITWNGGGALSLDLSGMDRLVLDIVNATSDVAGTVPMQVRLASVAGTVSVTRNVSPGGGSQQAVWFLSEFAGVNTSAITGISLSLTASMAVDEYLDLTATHFAAVPEPGWNAACAAAGLGLFALLRRRRAGNLGKSKPHGPPFRR
jgi:hypothetical protein